VEFLVPPFRFRFELNEERKTSSKSQSINHSYTEKSINVSNTQYSQTSEGPSFQNDEKAGLGGGTVVSNQLVVANLKALGPSGEVKQIYRLEGDAWVAGRDSGCSIFVDSKKFSRKQFEIYKQGDIYYLRDLGSANGTLLNAQQVPNDGWTRINSGDIVQVLDKHFLFELKDSNYQNRLSDAQAIISAPVQPIAEYQDSTPDENSLPQLEYTEKQAANKTRFILIGLILIAGAGALLMDGQESKEPVKKKILSKQEEAFSKLTKLKQEEIKDFHERAWSFFKQGKYEMARQEAMKINQILPLGYLDSLDIEKMAQQGIDDIAAKARLETEEKERAEREEKIIKQTNICRKLLNTNIEVRTMDECLAPVIEFDPSHAAIVDLKMQVDKLIADRNMRDAQKAEYNEKVSQRTKLFGKAMELQRKEKFLIAIKAHHENIESKLPDPNETRARSKLEIARIEKELEIRQSRFESEADEFYKKSDLKNAIISLRKAVDINPDNEVTKGRLSVVDFDLKKQMQALFQEGILEESLGELETAKTKWKKIIELSLPDEDYYKRATIKLKKYGVL
jgi:pSer/pThr/pTyr-binding forkhead associated (FHA) protein